MTREQFIFTRQFPQRLYRHVLFWLSYYFFSLLTYFHDGLEKVGFDHWVILEASEVFVQILFQMIFCYTVLYYLLPVFLNVKKYARFITGIILLSLAMVFLTYKVEIIIFKNIHTRTGLPFRPPAVFFWFTLIAFFSYFPISTGLVIAIKTLKNFYLKQKENESLMHENANAELQLLKAQIHPHFLFNTLNNIYSFTLNKSMQAPQLLMNLSDTLRYMINDCDAALVPVEKEIKMLCDYIGLEKVRYGQRLQIEVCITGDNRNKFITPLLLIPFLENSFKHGASKMRGNSWIKMGINIENNLLLLELSNSKDTFSKPIDKNSGIGLKNIKKRLAILYPQEHKLYISDAHDFYQVSLQLPVQLMEEGR